MNEFDYWDFNKMNYKKIAKSLKRSFEKKGVRTLRDMKSSFADKNEVRKILKKRNPVIYRTYRRRLKGSRRISLTVVNVGDVGREFFMTKGHRHNKSFFEIYVLVEGKGKLILGNRKIITLRKNKEVKIKGTTGHRLVNVGRTKLEVITIETAGLKHDYKIKFPRRILK